MAAIPPKGHFVMSENEQEASPQNLEALPQSVQDYIKELRRESQGYREREKSALAERDELAGKVEELQATVQLTDDTAKELEGTLTKEQFGRKFDRLAFERNIPLNIASTITAETEEDAIAKLDSLKEWRGTQETPEKRPDPAQTAEPVVDEQAELAARFFGK